MDQDDLSDLPAVQPSDTIAVGSSGMIETISQEEDIEEENMEEDDDDDEVIEKNFNFKLKTLEIERTFFH